MRGKDEQQLDVFSYLSPEQRVPAALQRFLSVKYGIVPVS
jgi:hypothetical protein